MGIVDYGLISWNFMGFCVGLSQWSFEYIEVALYTITKSTSIIFILFFAIILGLERKVLPFPHFVIEIRNSMKICILTTVFTVILS
jgi:hypothetical protein